MAGRLRRPQRARRRSIWKGRRGMGGLKTCGLADLCETDVVHPLPSSRFSAVDRSPSMKTCLGARFVRACARIKWVEQARVFHVVTPVDLHGRLRNA